LTVLGAGKPTENPGSSLKTAQDVDTVDLGRLRGHRLVASGRSALAGSGHTAWSVPDSALVEPKRRGWMTRSEPEAATLAPGDSTGLAWSAVGLKVAHIDRPHRLSVTVLGGHPSS